MTGNICVDENVGLFGNRRNKKKKRKFVTENLKQRQNAERGGGNKIYEGRSISLYPNYEGIKLES